MSIQYRFIEAFDTLSFRGNKLFGDAGSFGESQFPPKPSVLSGAFRSSLLATLPASEIGRFAQGLSDPDMATILGTPTEPGSFQLAALYPALKHPDGRIECLLPLPADVVIYSKSKELAIQIKALTPQLLAPELDSSYPDELPMQPVLCQSGQGKPESGWLLTQSGIVAYLAGISLTKEHIIKTCDLWKSEFRVGITLSGESRTAAEGKLFTVEQVAPQNAQSKLQTTSGLVVGIQGCKDRLPDQGLIRLGGDGHAAQYTVANPGLPAIAYQQIKANGRFKLIMQTPGLFANGWLPDIVRKENGIWKLEMDGFSARLCCVASNRFDVISGWDLFHRCPKSAERIAPTGSVYWFDQVEGDVAALGKLAETGLWSAGGNTTITSRQTEGYNRLLVAVW